MRLVIAAVGRLKAGPERELAERYRERAISAGRSLGFRGVEIAEIDESRSRTAPERVAAEAAQLEKSLPDAAVLIALDARGKSLSSEDFAQRLGQWRDHGQASGCFVIGGADGLADRLRARATLTLAFGAATWPHQLVRIMLLEQIYRAVTILSGHPYHRA
jgi:23S rRNA (pseudouridine1915-N3)-methyltransferase